MDELLRAVGLGRLFAFRSSNRYDRKQCNAKQEDLCFLVRIHSTVSTAKYVPVLRSELAEPGAIGLYNTTSSCFFHPSAKAIQWQAPHDTPQLCTYNSQQHHCSYRSQHQQNKQTYDRARGRLCFVRVDALPLRARCGPVLGCARSCGRFDDVDLIILNPDPGGTAGRERTTAQRIRRYEFTTIGSLHHLTLYNSRECRDRNIVLTVKSTCHSQ